MRLPLLGGDDESLGRILATHAVDRPGAWIREAITASLAQTVSVAGADRVLLDFRTGPSVLLPTGGQGGNTKVLGVYGVHVLFRDDALSVGMGGDAFSILTEDYDSFDDRTLQRFTFDASAKAGPVTPFAQVLVPLDGEDDDYLGGGWAHSLGARVPLPETNRHHAGARRNGCRLFRQRRFPVI